MRIKGTIKVAYEKFELEIDDDSTPDQVEKLAKEEAFSTLDWSYHIVTTTAEHKVNETLSHIAEKSQMG